jgi:hypothetical protein
VTQSEYLRRPIGDAVACPGLVVIEIGGEITKTSMIAFAF